MNKLNKFAEILAVLLLIFLTACNEDDVSLPKNEDNAAKLTDDEFDVLYRMRNKDYKVSIEEATKLANQIMANLDSESPMGEGKQRKIATVLALTSDDLESKTLKTNEFTISIPDTIAYVFNFTEDSGYAIISGDTRIEKPILATVERGVLEMTTDNPGFALFLDGTENYVIRSIEQAVQKQDSLLGGIVTKLEANAVNYKGNANTTAAAAANGTTLQNILFGNYIIKTTTTTGSITTALKKSPLLPVEWGQGEPYNQAVSMSCSSGGSGGKAWAGCVAAATAQIMAYWKYPAQVNWTLLNKYTGRPNAYPNVMGKLDAFYAVGAEAEAFRTQVANLMKEIGQGVGMKYGCDGSSAQAPDAVSFMRRLGYKGGSSSFLNIYNFPETYNSVYQDKPVLISGYSTKVKHKFLGITIFNTYEKGHAWVVDGYLRQQQQVTVTVQLIKKTTGQVISQSTHTGYNYINFLHNNWGWDGLDDGYYVEGAFNANAQELSSSSKKTLEEGQKNNYQYQIRIYSGIYKP
ncbi:MAG: C10 family peptidase [Flavobacteriaceae bacterium]|jgi:hypothetical protein|nr:C10 family peptidase [Flavobacteriaceae bacterium]